MRIRNLFGCQGIPNVYIKEVPWYNEYLSLSFFILHSTAGQVFQASLRAF